MKRLVTSAAAHSWAPRADFYARWIDHQSWPEWDPDTLWCRIDGPAAPGTSGAMKPKGGPTVRFAIKAAVPGEEYTDVSRLPGARLTFQHLARQTPTGTDLEAIVTIDGPLAWLWSLIMGAGFRRSVPDGLARLVTLVEAERSAASA